MAGTLQNVGADDSGTQDAHANAKGLQLDGQSLGHADDGELACGIGGKALTAGGSRIDHPGHRRGVDDVPALAMRSHVRQEGTHTVDDADQVDIENPVPVVECDMVNAAPSTNPGVVA